MQRQDLYVWDRLVRVFHWSLVAAFLANALIVDDESKLHLGVGYFMVALVVLRIVWGFIGSPYARFASFRPSASRSLAQVNDILHARRTAHKGHSPLGALMIYNLILTLAVIAISGYLMTTDRFWGVEWPEELHEAAVFWAETSVVLHVAAVIFESLRTRVNLPRSMLTGYKKLG